MRVITSIDFLDAYARVQKAQQKRVREFIELFYQDPTSPGIHFHPIEHARDPNLYSVRIDQTYRAIVYHPRDTDNFMLVWVDNHDDAYAWAVRRVFSAHQLTGALQVLPTDWLESIEQQSPPEPVGVPKTLLLRPLDAHDDRTLLCFGVPGDLLPMVRTVRDVTDLHRFRTALPQEAYEGLHFLLSGEPVHEVLAAFGIVPDTRPPAAVSLEDSLSKPDSSRRFRVIESAQELTDLLDAPLDRWRVFLHPRQRRLATMDADGPVCVLGGAGTGKTVVAMHRAKHLVESIFTAPTDRILFTTFTRNLVIDLYQNLKKIVRAEDLHRIEVVHMDGWVERFLEKRNHPFRPPTDEEYQRIWDQALASAIPTLQFPSYFYRQEWERVIQEQEIRTLAQYQAAQRPGRGSKISQDARAHMWPAFVEYRSRLEAQGIREHTDLLRDARRLIEAEGVTLPYRSIVVDETQDMSPDAMRLIRAMVPQGRNDLFVVGDAHQRIYRHKASLRACGIDVRGRKTELRVNYRTTEEILNYANSLLTGRELDDLDDGLDGSRSCMSLTRGIQPEVRSFRTAGEEQAFIQSHIRRLQGEGVPLEAICVTARTRRLLEEHMDALRRAGFDVCQIKADGADDSGRAAVRAATMHRVKGLEFEHMIIASANEGVIPLARALDTGGDEAARKDAETSERALLYVALTRARKSVVVTAWGTRSQILES
jgi:hypothetical protein